MAVTQEPKPTDTAADEWWRSAVVYQIYPRSFADANGDGTGDLAGIVAKLPYLAGLGVDAIWISPWYPSPMADGGYDVSDYRDIRPEFGTLADAGAVISGAHAVGLRVLIDLVPNHCSDAHPWFAAALADPEAPERALFWFRDGRGPDGAEPPNNWPSMFGGPAWTRTTDPDGSPGQWYLHLFAPEQPDWDWTNPAVADEFDAVLRFWFDRGVDGFRVDVATAMAKQEGLPDLPVDPTTGEASMQMLGGDMPFFDRPEVHDILRRWRTVADSYADDPQGPRVFVAEAWVSPADKLARYVRPDEMNTTFNFDALMCGWEPASQRNMIDISLASTAAVGAPATWVLANHDVTRVVTRYGRAVTGLRFTPDGIDPASAGQLAGFLGGGEPEPVAVDLGRRRARAAALLELALPGGAYVYQGDELGLEEIEDLPADVLDDPTWERSGHTRRGRDGCRVPLPWSGAQPPFGFGSAAAPPWLPQPARWAERTVAAQEADPDSSLALYRQALALRRDDPALGAGRLSWDDDVPDGVLSFRREPGFRCLVNFGPDPVRLPDGELLVASGPVDDGLLPVDTAAWLRD